MKMIMEKLKNDPQVTDYKLNLTEKRSYECFYVKGKLETVRCTDTCDKLVTVYVDHDGFKGDSQFYVYASTTEEELTRLVAEAAEKAGLLDNQMYALPENQTGEFAVPGNFSQTSLQELGQQIARAVFAANTLENADLNSVEIFVNCYTDTVVNSRGIHKVQTRYNAMVETIPTYNGRTESVELYHQYNFSTFDAAALTAEVREKLQQVKDRAAAVRPQMVTDCPVILHKQELASLFGSISRDLNYATVYSHANLFQKGDEIQQAPEGDRITITMCGSLPGNIRSACFDGDGMSLGDITVIRDGNAVAYYGASRFGQYLQEEPTGNLGCMRVNTGSATDSWKQQPALEVVSMSGLQVDPFHDYIGGEVRLAYYHDGKTVTPVTGISITGSLKKVLSSIRLSAAEGVYNGYQGPEFAVLQDMQIF